MARTRSTVTVLDAVKMHHAVDAARSKNPLRAPTRAHNPQGEYIMAQGGKINPTPNPSRAHIYPQLDGGYTRDTYYNWTLICFAWFAGFITCYLWLTN
jgi:hypothetical protein